MKHAFTGPLFFFRNSVAHSLSHSRIKYRPNGSRGACEFSHDLVGKNSRKKKKVYAFYTIIQYDANLVIFSFCDFKRNSQKIALSGNVSMRFYRTLLLWERIQYCVINILYKKIKNGTHPSFSEKSCSWKKKKKQWQYFLHTKKKQYITLYTSKLHFYHSKAGIFFSTTWHYQRKTLHSITKNELVFIFFSCKLTSMAVIYSGFWLHKRDH